MRNYQKDVMAYTKGQGRLFCSLKGYEPCHNTEEIIAMVGYDSERDIANPTESVFCANGSGFLVNWDEVKDYMHVESCFQKKDDLLEAATGNYASYTEEKWIDSEEVDKILNQTYYANQGKKTVWQKQRTASESYYKSTDYRNEPRDSKEEYLLVDGYNIIHTWPELKELADGNMEGARIKLLDSLSNYRGIQKCNIIVVFDAYRVQGHLEEVIDYDNIHVVYTKEAQTADQYIERFAHDNQKKYNITVATSDGLQQIITRGAGCYLLSARELKEEIERANERVIQEFQKNQTLDFNYLKDALSTGTKQQMDELFQEEKDK
jgi:predicted RNA-binding protein with PIN domain